jgi:phospholipid/cholesterol/gamma-HCH transport system substrate-binding protein
MIKNRIQSMDETTAEDAARVEELLASVPPHTGRREVWVGLFVLAGMIAVLVALFTLTDVSTLRSRYNVTTVVQDAGGVRKGDPVQMRGVNIGRVRRFEMVPGGVSLRLELDKEYPVPVDSRIVLRSLGLLGGTVAEVIPGESREVLRRGETLPGASDPGAFEAAAGLGVRADTVLTRVQALLSPRTVSAVGTSALEMQTLLSDLSAVAAEQRRELAALSTSLRRSAAGVERATTGPELERSIAHVDSLTARLNQTTASLEQSSASLQIILARIERGEGTLGKLTRDDSLYVNLNRAAANLNALAEDIRRDPKRYLSVSVF